MRSGCWTNRGGGAGVQLDPDRPVLIDKYLDRADELDVDALCDKDGNVVITGIMQHIEQAPSPTPPRAVSCPPGSTGATARLHCRTPSIEHSVAVRQCRRSPVADFSLRWVQAGVHSGDSACVIPAQTISDDCLQVHSSAGRQGCTRTAGIH